MIPVQGKLIFHCMFLPFKFMLWLHSIYQKINQINLVSFKNKDMFNPWQNIVVY